MKEYIIKININASKETVWNVITDFENYPKWNSVLKMDKNDNLILGDNFDVSIVQPNGKKSNFKATAIGKEEFQSFSASQTIIGKWFFQAIHFFIIEEVDEEHVTFIQKWELKGIIALLFRKQICKELEVFKLMNKELKEVIEE